MPEVASEGKRIRDKLIIRVSETTPSTAVMLMNGKESRLRSDQEHSSARYPKVFTSFGCRVRLCPPSSSSKYGSSQLQDTVPQEKPRSSSSIEDRHGRAEGRREEKEISPPCVHSCWSIDQEEALQCRLLHKVYPERSRFPRYLCVLLAAPGNTHPKWPTIGIRNYIFYCGDADERRVGGNATAGRKDYNNLVEQFDSASPRRASSSPPRLRGIRQLVDGSTLLMAEEQRKWKMRTHIQSCLGRAFDSDYRPVLLSFKKQYHKSGTTREFLFNRCSTWQPGRAREREATSSAATISRKRMDIKSERILNGIGGQKPEEGPLLMELLSRAREEEQKDRIRKVAFGSLCCGYEKSKTKPDLESFCKFFAIQEFMEDRGADRKSKTNTSTWIQVELT
ncbi:hypothetical protein RB195_022437 [Necator americanus]|uniref:Uncharacterized protein n=1 Tax=Necator americanus TaxID=51031 RepID=A0ABR1EFZ1_NECAM